MSFQFGLTGGSKDGRRAYALFEWYIKALNHKFDEGRADMYTPRTWNPESLPGT
jgi:hypothetical protein